MNLCIYRCSHLFSTSSNEQLQSSFQHKEKDALKAFLDEESELVRSDTPGAGSTWSTFKTIIM